MSRPGRWFLAGAVLLLFACSTNERVDPPAAPGAVDEPTVNDEVPRHPESNRERIRLTISGADFLMEVSDDDVERHQGLSGRTRLGSDEGMIFVYPRAKILGYWMKDCLIDLEIVYVRGDGTIMSMHRMKKEPPRGDEERLSAYEERLPRYPSRHSVQFVLEFAPGTIDRLKLKKGAKIVLPRKALLENAR